MNRVVVVGLSFRTTPVELRERLSFTQSRLRKALQALGELEGVEERVILSTCNRVEVYARHRHGAGGAEEIRRFVCKFHGLPEADLAESFYAFSGREAVRHAFRVASSLDSMVVGEPQILGQFKDAYEEALACKASGPVLNRLMRKALSVAKRVRTETRIAENAVSISFTAVELAKQIFGDLGHTTVLLVGAGEMGELAARHLVNNGAKALLVANRTQRRAEGLAKELGGRAVPLASLEDELPLADIVVSCTDALQYLIHQETVARVLHVRRNRPMFFIDIAVPRDIDPAVNDLENAFLYDIDDLQAVVDANLEGRQQEANRAEGIVAQEAEAFLEWSKSLDAVPTITQLREKMERIRQEELANALARLNGIRPEDREALERLTVSIVNKLMHAPLVALKQEAASSSVENFVEVVRRLFHLDSKGPPHVHRPVRQGGSPENEA